MSDEQRTVSVFQATDPLQIGMVKSALKEAGIAFTAANDVVSSVYPTDGMLIVRFEVFELDAERAAAVIRGLGFEHKRPPRIARAAQQAAAQQAEGEGVPEPDVGAGHAAGQSPSFEILVRVPPNEAIERISRALKCAGGLQAHVTGSRFRIRSEHRFFPASCTGSARPAGDGCVLRANFAAPVLLKLGVLLWLGPPASLLVFAAVAGVLRWRWLFERPGVAVGVAAVSAVGLVTTVFGKVLSARRERRIRALLESTFEGVAVPSDEQL